MKRLRTLDSWYKPVISAESNVNNDQPPEPVETQATVIEQNPLEPIETQATVIEQNASVPSENEQARVLTTPFEREPGRRKQIWELSPAEQIWELSPLSLLILYLFYL
jgi:hypothetical protein